MISQILHQLDKTTELLQWFNGSTVIVKTAKTFTAANIHVGLTAGDKLYITGTSSGTSDGIYTIATVATGELTMSETPAGSNETATITINQEYQGAWIKVDRWAKLTGLFNCTGGSATVYVDQSGDRGTTVDYSSSFSATTATALAFSVETVATHARLRIRNNGTDQSVLRGYLYGRATT
jgi:hypothetical protein